MLYPVPPVEHHLPAGGNRHFWSCIMALSRTDKAEIIAMAIGMAVALYCCAGCTFDLDHKVRQGVKQSIESDATFTVGLGGIKGFEEVPNLVEGKILSGQTHIDIKMPFVTWLASVLMTGTQGGGTMLVELVTWLGETGKFATDLVLRR